MRMKFDYKKAVHLLSLLAEKEGGIINKMKALKLIWLADRVHLRRYARPIINDEYFALPYGPVASTTSNIIEKQSSYISPEFINYSLNYIEKVDKHHYVTIKKPNLKKFSKTDLNAINEVYDVYGKLSERELSAISHEYPEWKQFESKINSENRREKMSYEDFFLNPEAAEETALFNEPSNDLELTKEIFLENQKIYTTLWA